MSAQSTIETVKKEEVIDNISDEQVGEKIDLNKLAALKAKQQANQTQAKQQEEKMANKLVAQKTRSLQIGCVGSGQAGSRIAEAMFKLGYPAIALNTAIQDLRFISVPDSNKLLLEYGVGGASKELSIGNSAAEAHKVEITQLINEKLSDAQVLFLTFSLGGGSGAGSCEVLVDIMSELGKPLVVISVLPMDTDDAQTKQNALETLSKLAGYAKSKKISNLILVDNARIEAIYHDANQFDFFNLANKSIVDTLDAFNTLSSMPSAVKALDAMEWSKILIDSGGLSCFGEFNIENYSEDTSIAEGVISNLSNNLLANGFDLAGARYIGFMVVANSEVWSKIPASSINYATSMVNDLAPGARGVFKGIYTVDSQDNYVKVYSFFSGLSLPMERIDQLKKETVELQSKIKVKDDERNLSLHLNAGTNETISSAQAIKNKIAAKSSVFGKFVNNSTSDRRK